MKLFHSERALMHSAELQEDKLVLLWVGVLPEFLTSKRSASDLDKCTTHAIT